MSFLTKTAGGAGRSLLVCALVLGIGIAGFAGLLVSNLRQRALLASGSELQRLALVLAQQADRSLQSVDLVQTGLLERLRGIKTPGQFRREMAGREIHDELRNRIEGLPQIHTLTLLDADGNLINFSLSWPAKPVNVSDRQFFSALKTDPQRMTYISEPIRSRAISTWTVIVARKIVSSDGSFLGLIVAALNLPDFERLYQSADLGANSSVTLFRQDGVQFVSFPHAEQDIGRRFPISVHFHELLATGSFSDLERRIDPADGQDKLVAVSLLPDYPLAISIERTVDQALTEWRHLRDYLLAATALLESVIIGLGLLMMRQLRSQRLLAVAGAELALAREREIAQDQARIQHARLGAALDHMSQGLAIFDAGDRLVVANARHATMLGISAAGDLAGIDITALLDLSVAAGVIASAAAREMVTAILANIANVAPMSHMLELEDGRRLAVSFSPISGGGWLFTLDDVTERLCAEAQITHMAHHDALTGLANRLLFRERLEQALALSRRGETFALLCLDLDRFKPVNDGFGHAVGDALLRAVAERMRRAVRDIDTVARLGGDEFAIIQAGIDHPSDAEALSMRLIQSLGAVYGLDGRLISIGVSIGIAISPGSGCDAETVLNNADLALYRAKSEGRGMFRSFETAHDARLRTSLVPEPDLFDLPVNG